jgi:transposase
MAARGRKSLDRSRSSESRCTRAELRERFPDDAACLEWLKEQRWPGGIHCVKCDRITGHHRVKARQSYSCDFCGHHVYPTAGTIFHKSTTSLTLWFDAVYLMTATRCGISAKQLEREIGVTYKTAWRMFKLIRTLLDDDHTPLSGTVEVDETYFAKSKRLGNRPGRSGYSPGEQVVLGMVERHGRVVARHITGTDGMTINRQIATHVLPASMVFTDDAGVYRSLAKRGYQHRRVNHSAKVYVAGDVHTQTIEGFWSLLKRGISGVYHQVGDAYLQSYSNEYAWRYNHRHDARGMVFTLLVRASRPA